MMQSALPLALLLLLLVQHVERTVVSARIRSALLRVLLQRAHVTAEAAHAADLLIAQLIIERTVASSSPPRVLL